VGFTGWPAEAFDLYAGLELDNSRSYWQAHREVYERAVREPFAELSEEIEKRFGALRLFRPYRDTRFSRDKTPYKTNAAAATEGEGGATYYISLSATGLFAGTGMYHLMTDQLDRFRAAIDDGRRGAQLEKIVAALEAQRYGVGSMESLKTVPRGYARDHPRSALLRRKGLTSGREFPRARWMQTAAALTRVTKVWEDAAPMNRWLERNVGPSTLPPPEPA
jgi:uncharacterized protein (TIGR02453 family)